jgi:hypothetical protein
MLDELRRLAAASEASADQRGELARALVERHWEQLHKQHRRDDAAQTLDELRALCRAPEADERQRFELSKALGGAHWDAVRHGDTQAAARLQTEMRRLASRREATEGQRWALAEALANEVRHHSGARGDPALVDGLVRDLEKLAHRPHATETQRDALARALLHLHHAAREHPDRSNRKADALLEELRSLATRPETTMAQRLAFVEALFDTPWKAGLLGDRRRQSGWLEATIAAERQSGSTHRQRVLLCDTVVRMHAKVRRAEDDAFADLLLDRLRAMAVRPDATIEQWISLASAVCDGLWISGRFSNRDLAEELVEVLTLLTGGVEAGVRKRMSLAGLLVGAHHRAVRSHDALLSKELLTLLHAWALRPEASREEGEVLAHGLRLARSHAAESGDGALERRISQALRALEQAPAPKRARAWHGADLGLGAAG